MPPKGGAGKGGGGGGGGQKQAQASAAKKVADATFGMKNKSKSKKVQTYITNIEKSYTGGQHAKPLDPDANKSKKALKAEKAAELGEYFRPVVAAAPKLAPGEDPKSVLCEFFKMGTCTKGAKCKFSHDVNVARKGAKIDVYTDRRDGAPPDDGDSMESWDEATLRSVVSKKEGRPNQTQIVCKFFLEAIENKKYGWFWECPNGARCQYRHALPPGFVFDKKEDADALAAEAAEPMEKTMEEERASLRGGTPMTYDLFLVWKERKRLAKESEDAGRLDAAKKSRNLAGMSGREMFEFKPELFADDDSAASRETFSTKNPAAQNCVQEADDDDDDDDVVLPEESGSEPSPTAAPDSTAAAAAGVPDASAPLTTALDPSLFEDD